MYYQGWMEEQAQKLVDATARAFTQQRLLTAGMGMPGMPGMVCSYYSLLIHLLSPN